MNAAMVSRRNSKMTTEAAINKVHEVAKQAGLGRGKGGVSSCPCPKGCGGTVNFRVAQSNGHIMGTCTTAGCLAWME